MRDPVNKVARRAGLFALIFSLFLLPALAWASPAHEQSGTGTGGGSAAVQKALGTTDVQGFLDSMDADRLLLFEVRKALPDKRADANVYLARLKDLASKSDAARLVPKVNRLIEQAPIYYDWLEKNIQNQQDNQNEFVVGGARGFTVAFDDFQSEVLLVVINRLEMAGNAIRASTQSPG